MGEERGATQVIIQFVLFMPRAGQFGHIICVLIQGYIYIIKVTTKKFEDVVKLDFKIRHLIL